MSAYNWDTCPRCAMEAASAREKTIAKIKGSY